MSGSLRTTYQPLLPTQAKAAQKFAGSAAAQQSAKAAEPSAPVDAVVVDSVKIEAVKPEAAPAAPAPVTKPVTKKTQGLWYRVGKWRDQRKVAGMKDKQQKMDFLGKTLYEKYIAVGDLDAAVMAAKDAIAAAPDNSTRGNAANDEKLRFGKVFLELAIIQQRLKGGATEVQGVDKTLLEALKTTSQDFKKLTGEFLEKFANTSRYGAAMALNYEALVALSRYSRLFDEHDKARKGENTIGLACRASTMKDINDPTNDTAHATLGLAYEMYGKIDPAISMFNHVFNISKNPLLRVVCYERSQALFAANQGKADLSRITPIKDKAYEASAAFAEAREFVRKANIDLNDLA